MSRFQGLTAIITGASSGVGEACARAFSAEGANVVLVARSKDKLNALQKQITNSYAYPADLSNPKTFDKLFQSIEKKFGQINILVNNAGVNYRGAVDEVEQDLGLIIDLNLRTPIVMTQKAIQYIKKAGRGAIVNVASLAGRVPLAHEATYSASKFGLRAFSLSMAQETEGTGIHVSVVSPGPIDTGFIQKDIETVPPLVFSQTMSTAEQVAEMVLDCAFDGKPERVIPKAGGFLTTTGYLFPSLRKALLPIMQKKGEKAKRKYIAQLPPAPPEPIKPPKKTAKKTKKAPKKASPRKRR